MAILSFPLAALLASPALGGQTEETSTNAEHRDSKVDLKKVFDSKPLKAGRALEWSHAPYNTGRCNWCHLTNRRPEPGALKMPTETLCLNCHTYLEKKKFSHSPAKNDCTFCHNGHNSKHLMFLHRPVGELCVACHVEMREKFEARYNHGPVGDKTGCGNCHQSHWSDHEKLLLDEQRELCFRCHGGVKPVRARKGRVLENIRNQTKWRVKHKPFKDDKCSVCHESHGSSYPILLVRNYPRSFYTSYSREKYSLCFDCHREQRITTEKTVSATGFRRGEMNLHYVHVVKPKEGRTCRACHHNHATANPHLIRQKVRYGSTSWKMDLDYIETAEGGRCSRTCHEDETYNNNGSRPRDIARKYKVRPNLSP